MLLLVDFFLVCVLLKHIYIETMPEDIFFYRDKNDPKCNQPYLMLVWHFVRVLVHFKSEIKVHCSRAVNQLLDINPPNVRD